MVASTGEPVEACAPVFRDASLPLRELVCGTRYLEGLVMTPVPFGVRMAQPAA